MLITLETTHDDERRLYLARTGSLQAFFTDDGEGGSMLHVEPGWLAREDLFAISDYAGVRQAAFETVAKKLGCPPHEVARHSFAELAALADPASYPARQMAGQRKARKSLLR